LDFFLSTFKMAPTNTKMERREREKNNVPVALVVLSFHLDRKDRKVLSLRQRDSPDSRRGPALFFSSPLSSLKKNSCWRF
jgi:hypothetical protein